MYDWKNVSSLLQAWYQLASEVRDRTQLVIVGDGPELDRLKALDSEGLVHFV
ncbi:MAG: glycosyltransferase family 4 protein [Candidatus Peribacteria bacterium]|nr:MAG: glycosyltransferase family 4 protein [Candidatus Peribacteria bacterium]